MMSKTRTPHAIHFFAERAKLAVDPVVVDSLDSIDAGTVLMYQFCPLDKDFIPLSHHAVVYGTSGNLRVAEMM